MAPSEAADSLPLLLESEEARSVLLSEVGGNAAPED
jgi:hypothetical protein